MYIRIEKSELLNAIAPCLCAIATRTMNAALACLYFKAERETG